MASLYQVLSALQQQISLVTVGLVSTTGPLTVYTGIDWPSVKVLQTMVGGGQVLVTVFDRKQSKNSTRWAPIVLSQTVVPATLTSTVSQGVFLTTSTITLGASVTNGDAVSCVLTNRAAFSGGTPEWATVVSGTGADTPSTMAYRLTNAINQDPILSTWVSAVQSGAAVTLTSLVSGPLTVQSYTGNGATEVEEIGRRNRLLQVVIWAGTIEDRDTVANPVEAMLASMQMFLPPYGEGLTFADGSSGYVQPVNDYELDDSTLSDTYRRDFVVTCDYPITTANALWAVLAPIQQYQLSR